MGTHLYTKTTPKNVRKPLRFLGLCMAIFGLLFGLYTFFPLLSWELYLKPAYASTSFESPIPQTTIMTKDTLRSLLENSFHNGNWLPSVYDGAQVTSTITSYSLSIPKLTINEATVSTIDTKIDQHLVQFPGTALPPHKGNAVVFGHSTLPSLYDPKNYKTIFANILELKVGDKITLHVNNVTYTYTVVTITIVDAEDTSYLTQDQNDTYLTIVTCTPPGTTWKRLVIKSRIEKI